MNKNNTRVDVKPYRRRSDLLVSKRSTLGAVMMEYTIVTLTLAIIVWVAFAGTDSSFERSENPTEHGVADLLQDKQQRFRNSIQQP